MAKVSVKTAPESAGTSWRIFIMVAALAAPLCLVGSGCETIKSIDSTIDSALEDEHDGSAPGDSHARTGDDWNATSVRGDIDWY